MGCVVDLCERRRLRLCLCGKQCAVCVWIVQTQWGLALAPRMSTCPCIDHGGQLAFPRWTCVADEVLAVDGVPYLSGCG